MNSETGESRRRWIAAVVGASAIVAVVVALLRIPQVPPAAPAWAKPAPAPAVEVAPVGGRDRTLAEATVMHDQTPLFLPTDRNVALAPLPPLEAGGTLLNREQEKLSFGGRELTLAIPPPTEVPERPAETILAGVPPVSLHGFGRIEERVPPLPARGAWLEVFAVRDNRRVLGERLPVSAQPPVDKAWRPMEFTAAVEAAGLVGSLAVTERSDAEEVERFFRNYLAHTFRLGERLPPGFYRVVIGP